MSLRGSELGPSTGPCRTPPPRRSWSIDQEARMYENLDPGPSPMPDVQWNIQRAGREWTKDEALGRYELTPEKFEMIDGKLFWEETERLTLLALLLENVGADQAVRLGDPEVWRAAVKDLG
jgi:hypothetical protein